MVQSKYEKKTIAYTQLLNRLQAINFNLSDLDKITYQQFNQMLNSKAKTDGQYKRALALARNEHIQKDVNQHIKKKKIPSYIIKPIKVKEYIPKKIKRKVVKHKPKRLCYINKPSFPKYYERLIYHVLARNQMKKLANAWNLYQIKKRKLVGSQEVQITVNYDLENENGKVIWYDDWITFGSGLTREKNLLTCFDIAYNKLQDWIELMLLQSKLVVRIKDIYTIVYRFGN